jgi:prevent-host-death family protein
MKAAHWSVARAKAALSQVLAATAAAPQVIEKRGKPVAVVISLEQYQQSIGDPAEGAARLGRWQAFLRASGELRSGGGANLARSKRTPRGSPFRAGK